LHPFNQQSLAGAPYDARAAHQPLDAGYLAMKIGGCYERIGDLHAAKYWYGRAVEENPEVPAYVEARRRLDSITIDDLLPQHN
jgi:hypothetical protein